MNLQVRDPRARKLAKRLAELKKTNMSEAVIAALESELSRANAPRQSAADIAREIRESLDRISRPGGRKMTKDEIDEMWWG